MAKKDYTEIEQRRSQQAADTQQTVEALLPPLTEAINSLNRVINDLQNQLLSQTPQPATNPFQGTAAENAVNVYNGIVAGLRLQPTPIAPDLLEAVAKSSTEIKLEWDWFGQPDDLDGFKIFRCQGQDCEDFVEIEKNISPSEREFLDRNLSRGETYRYKMSAFKFERESAFSTIMEAKTNGS